MSPEPRALRVLVAVLLGTAVAAACGPSTPEGVIDRETFIEAYVELRVAALSTDTARIAASDREAVLDEMGITEDDLIEFVEVHATDLEFMRDVWNEVELRMDSPVEGVAEAEEG